MDKKQKAIEVFDKANEAYRKGNIKEAKKLWQTCIDIGNKKYSSFAKYNLRVKGN